MTIQFIVYGDPKQLRRHRSFRNKKTGFIGQYADPESEKDKENFRTVAVQNRPPQLIEGAITLQMTFFISIPKSMSKKRRELAIQGKIRPITRPDLDNYIKLVLDACNKVIWRDDSQIAVLYSAKLYSEVPRTEISIEEI